ncbi:MAG: DUF2958 domain-containing protein [Dehalococcoidia bacterium]|nr:DUF2958 domain-containing protein [Dehalococcoidia bacterium]
MKLLTAADRRALPALYAQESRGYDAVAYVKFFDPCGAATWYITEFDGDDILFGLCDLGFGEPELGYVNLSELQAVRGPLGLGVERDLYWTPRALRECAVSGVLR